MARKKSYDREEAVQKAMKAFWVRGYSNLGVREIERETGINRFALQTDFGGKPGLFEEVLERYRNLAGESGMDALLRGSLDGIAEFFRLRTRRCAETAEDPGCLMVNTTIENADLQMARIGKITDEHYEALRGGFADALNRGIEKGELPSSFDVKGAAATLLSVAIGIEVLVRMKKDRSAVEEQVAFVTNLLEMWKVLS